MSLETGRSPIRENFGCPCLGVRLYATGDGELLKSFKWGNGHSSMEKNWSKTK